MGRTQSGGDENLAGPAGARGLQIAWREPRAAQRAHGEILDHLSELVVLRPECAVLSAGTARLSMTWVIWSCLARTASACRRMRRSTSALMTTERSSAIARAP
jgi:hypothetical protein